MVVRAHSGAPTQAGDRVARIVGIDEEAGVACPFARGAGDIGCEGSCARAVRRSSPRPVAAMSAARRKLAGVEPPVGRGEGERVPSPACGRRRPDEVGSDEGAGRDCSVPEEGAYSATPSSDPASRGHPLPQAGEGRPPPVSIRSRMRRACGWRANSASAPCAIASPRSTSSFALHAPHASAFLAACLPARSRTPSPAQSKRTSAETSASDGALPSSTRKPNFPGRACRGGVPASRASSAATSGPDVGGRREARRAGSRSRCGPTRPPRPHRRARARATHRGGPAACPASRRASAGWRGR